MTELNDQTLLAYWYRHRNAEAFHILASRHARMVYATALRVLRDAQEAEDVSQESFLALAQAKFPPSRNVAAWLHRTTYRAALNVARLRTRRGARDFEYQQAQLSASRSAWDDMQEHMDEAVAALPDKFREPLVRFFFEQESHAAIAASLGIPRQTVTYRIGRGIAQVRERLSAKGIVAPAGAALAALVQENSAAALPAGAAAEIGRVGLAASPSPWAVAATYTGGAALKVAAAALIVGTAALTVVGTGLVEAPRATAPEAAALAPAPDAPAVLGPELLLAANAGNEEEAGGASNTAGAGVLESGASAAGPGSVAGVVSFPEGHPFAGAIIQLDDAKRRDALNNPSAPYTGPTIEVDGVAYPMPGGHFEATADSAGRFEMADVTPGEYVVTVKPPEYGDITPYHENMRFVLSPGERKNDLKLVYGSEGSLSISGVVTNSAGVPMQGVRVSSSRPVPRIALSDGNGKFSLHYYPEGDVSLTAGIQQNTGGSSQTYYSGPVSARAGDRDVQIVLLASATLKGQIVDAKTRQPITRFEVMSMPGHYRNVHASMFGRRPPQEDAGGNFSIDFVRVGDVTVVAQAPGYSPGFLPVTVAEGEQLEGLVLELNRADRALAGRVVTAEGDPVPNTNIYLEDVPAPGRSGKRESSVAAVTDAEGAFSIENAPDTVQFLGAWHPDFAPGGSEASENMTIVLRKAGRLNVELLLGGSPLPEVRIIVAHMGAPGERYNSTSTRATTDADGHAVVEEIMPGKAGVHFLLPSKRSQKTILEFAPGEEKTLRIAMPPAEAIVEGTLLVNGAPAAEGSVQLYVDTKSGTETLGQTIAGDGTFHFPEVPLGLAQLVADTGGSAGRVYLDDVPLKAGEITVLSVDATMQARVSGAVNGVREGEFTHLVVLPGAMSMEEAIEAADRHAARESFANYVTVELTGVYDAPLHKPGTYTLLLLTFPTEAQWRREYHEARVVEIPESGELNVDFNLSR